MTEEFWANSMLSIARYYGRIQYEGLTYVIVDKYGRDLFECSAIAEKLGKDKAIEPGEPVDLVQQTFVPLYRELKREKFLEILKEHPEIKCAADMRKIVQNDK